MAGWNDPILCGDNIFEEPFVLSFNDHLLTNIRSPESHLHLEGVRQKCNSDIIFTDENGQIKTVDGIPVRTLFVSKIPHHAKWIDMHNAFAVFGDIKRLYLKSNTLKPFAFVTYVNPCSAVIALHQHQIFILGKKVYVAMGDSWHQPIENPDGTIDWSKQEKIKIEEDDEADDENIDETEAEVEQVMEDKQELRNSIDLLNDDCLSHVFSFLDYCQRLSVERVCKRWQAIIYTMWNRIHSLDYTSPSMSCIPLNLVTLECLLKRCNANLRTLNLCVKGHALDTKALVFIAKYCQNIEELYISQLPINNRSLPHLAKYCTKLKKIVFKECKYFTDNDLSKWFSRSQALTSVTITRTPGFNGSSLTALTTPLEYLNLNDCINLYPNQVHECLVQNSSTLKHLSLNACICLRGFDVSRIVKSVPNLTYLSLTQSFPKFNKQSLLPLGNLAHLQELNLTQNGCVTDQVVAAIVEGCKELTLLNLSGSRCDEGAPFTSEGLAKLGKLRKLTSLDISYLLQTNDVCLKNLTAKSTSLKFFKCVGCPALSDSGCTQVVSLCNELEQFDLSGNELVTNETVKTALNSVKLCTNRKPLELIVGGTLVDITSDDDRLIINQQDFCEFHLRPDFVESLFFPLSDDDDDLEHLCNELGLPGLTFEILLEEFNTLDSDLDTDDFDTDDLDTDNSDSVSDFL